MSHHYRWLIYSIGLHSASLRRCKDPEYYSRNYAIIGTLFQSIIFMIGVLGNVLVCTVVYREGGEYPSVVDQQGH